MKPTEKYDVREFVPLDVFKQFGQAAWQFVSDNIVKLHTFTDTFFNEYFKAKDPTIERVVIVCNDYHNKMLLGTFSNRGLRTVAYINSQLAKKISEKTKWFDYIIKYFSGITLISACMLGFFKDCTANNKEILEIKTDIVVLKVEVSNLKYETKGN